MVFLRKDLLTAFLLLIFSASCTIQDWFTPGGEYVTPDSPPSPPLAAQILPTSEAEETTSMEPAAEGKAPEELANQIEAELFHLPEIPPISIITPERPYVEPGMYASFLGHPNLMGELKLTGPNDMILMGYFSTGRGSITIPDDASPGLYIAAVNGSAGALAYGQIVVAIEPSLWVHIDRRNIRKDEVVEVHVSAYGLPEYSLAGIGLGRTDWKSVLSEIITHELPNLENENTGDMVLDNLEEDASNRFDLPVSILIPNKNGILVPSLTRLSSLQEMTAQPLLLPGYLAEQIQVFSIDARTLDGGAGAPIWVSDPVTIENCMDNGIVYGMLESSADVYFVSPSKGYLGVERAQPGTPFSIELPPGLIAVYAVHESGIGLSASEPVLADVRCGEAVEAILSTSISGSGDTRSSGVLTSKPNDHLLQNNPSLSPIEKFSSDQDVCKRFFVSIDAGQEVLHPFVAAYNHSLAAQIQDNLIHTGVHSQESVRTILRLAELKLQEGNQEAAASIMAEMSAAVEVDFLVQGKLSLLGDNHFLALSGINYKKDLPVTLDSGWYEQVEDMYGFGETGKNFIEKMADAAVCGKVISHQSEIEPGQNEEIVVHVTNLAGEVVDGAYFEAQAAVLGILTPTRGEISEGEFTTEYHANPEARGQEHLLFEIIWEGSAGPVKPERVESTLEIGGKYRLDGGLSAKPTTFPAAGLFQGLHFSMEAYSCQSGKGGPYEGSVTGGLGLSSYDEDLAGIPSEQSFRLPLSFNIPLEGEPFQLPAPFHSLTGRFHPGLDIIIFSSMGIPLFYADVTPLEIDAVCPAPDN